jgi:hypothetical protein
LPALSCSRMTFEMHLPRHLVAYTRDFSAMPILADALMDADCKNPQILEHCRGLGPHVRGCWVTDLCLNKS